MNVGSLKEGIKMLRYKFGEKEAVRMLTNSGGPNISVSVAEKLASGRYDSELSFDKGQAILKVLAEVGIVVASEAS